MTPAGVFFQVWRISADVRGFQRRLNNRNRKLLFVSSSLWAREGSTKGLVVDHSTASPHWFRVKGGVASLSGGEKDSSLNNMPTAGAC